MRANTEKEALLSHEALLEKLVYKPATGTLYHASNPKLFGQAAGSVNAQGYITIGLLLKGKVRKYLAHRLAWFYMTKSWPPQEVGHINKCKTDNSWSNLRLATSSQTSRAKCMSARNKSGHTGVYYEEKKDRWSARIDNTRLGYFATKEEAVATRLNAEKLRELADESI